MRNLAIDVLRGIAILLVLIHHFNIPYKLNDTFLGFQLFGESLSTLIARNGNYGVTLFFVISGFLITQHSLERYGSLAKIDMRAFYVRRIARIVPCLILLIVLVSILATIGFQPFLNQAPNGVAVSYGLTIFAALSFWMNLLIIQYGWVNYALGVLWSLSVEEVFYMVFPVLCFLLSWKNTFIIFLLGIIAYAPYFRFLNYGNENGAYLYHYFSSFDGIAIGCLTAIFAYKYQIYFRAKCTIIFMISILMCALYLYAPIKEVSTWSISLFAGLSAILIFLLSQNNSIQANNTQATSIMAKTLIWIGQRSYEMYLFHLIVLGMIKVFYLPKETIAAEKLMLLPIYFVFTFLLAWVIEKYYSKPLNLKIRKKLLTT